jgi:hypothetical protein
MNIVARIACLTAMHGTLVVAAFTIACALVNITPWDFIKEL